MDKLFKSIKYLDYLGAFASLGWGLYHLSALWISFGCIGLLFAWWSPARRTSAYVQSRFLSKRKIDARYSEVAEPFEETLQGSAPVGGAPFYGFRTDVPFPRRITVLRIKGADSFLAYALFVANRFSVKRG